MKIDNLIEQQEEQAESHSQFARDVLNGLQSIPKQVPAQYFYDEQGSILFQKITAHEDYYLTRAEYSILEKVNEELAASIDTDIIDIIELGVGDGHKTQLVLEGFLKLRKEINLYPIDISAKAMAQLGETLGQHERLTIHGVIADYFAGLAHVREHSTNRQLVLFLGSNIGNFNPLQSQRFLKKLRSILKPGDHLLIGFDLKKDIATLNRAYNDSAGYTRQFNLNLLQRINNELGGQFNLDQFEHYGAFNPRLGAMESFLISKQRQSVYIAALDSHFEFDKFEPVHLEYSFKYLEEEIEKLAEDTGFEVVHHYLDDEERFVDSLWRVS